MKVRDAAAVNVSFCVINKWLTQQLTMTQNGGIEMKKERTAANESVNQRKTTTSSKQSKRRKVLRKYDSDRLADFRGMETRRSTVAVRVCCEVFTKESTDRKQIASAY